MNWFYKNISGEAATTAACILNIAILISEENPEMQSEDCVEVAYECTRAGLAGFAEGEDA